MNFMYENDELISYHEISTLTWILCLMKSENWDEFDAFENFNYLTFVVNVEICDKNKFSVSFWALAKMLYFQFFHSKLMTSEG